MPAGDRFVVVPAERLFAFLEQRGFVRSRGRSRREVVYERGHERDARYHVIVYTSVAEGRAVARSRGSDAIRVCAVFDDGARSFGVAKLPKVLRTAPHGEEDERIKHVLERMLARMREAYAACSQRMRMGG